MEVQVEIGALQSTPRFLCPASARKGLTSRQGARTTPAHTDSANSANSTGSRLRGSATRHMPLPERLASHKIMHNHVCC